MYDLLPGLNQEGKEGLLPALLKVRYPAENGSADCLRATIETQRSPDEIWHPMTNQLRLAHTPSDRAILCP